MNRSTVSGFTLVEVMVALVIGGLITLMSHRLFTTALELGAAAQRAVRATEREQNARRLLAATLLSVGVGTSGDGPFEGSAGRMQFTAWMETADGWFERRRIQLSQDGDRFEATVTPGGTFTVQEGIAGLGFDYLLSSGNDSGWVREWISPVSAPLAIRIRIDRRTNGQLVSDTVMYAIKGRG